MRPIVGGRRTQQFVSRQFVSMSVQFELRGAIELPDDDEMREALDVGEPRLKLGQDLEHAIGLVFSAKTLGNFACVLVRTTHKSNRLRGKHNGECLHFERCSVPASQRGLAGTVGSSDEDTSGTDHWEEGADLFWRSARISCRRFFSMMT